LSSVDNKKNSELSLQFNAWVDRVMREFGATPSVAYNFHLYEHEDGFAIQLVGTSRFDPDDEDWACDETFSSGEDLFRLPHAVLGKEWRTGLKVASSARGPTPTALPPPNHIL
jgi:hypothetical protein